MAVRALYESDAQDLIATVALPRFARDMEGKRLRFTEIEVVVRTDKLNAPRRVRANHIRNSALVCFP